MSNKGGGDMGAKVLSNKLSLKSDSKGDLDQDLRRLGVVNLGYFFPEDIINKWNKLLDPIFEKRKSSEKSYVKINELYELGIFEDFFDTKMRSTMNKIMPDPVLLCFHVYETGHGEKPHVFGDSFNGWHRDVNDLPGMNCEDPNYISIFVHLSDVEFNGGAFETIPGSFKGPIRPSQESVRVVGKAGTTYIWNRCLLHKANPNQTQKRRRMLKISFQHNYLQNEHLVSEPFKSLLAKVSQGGNRDEFLNFVLGSEHRFSPRACTINPYQDFKSSYTPFESNSSVKISIFNFVKGALYYMRKARKMFGP
jgi:hypothetical protein